MTALPLSQCRERLDRDEPVQYRGVGSSLAPMTQRTIVQGNGAFTVERTFPGALQPIRFTGRLDDDEASSGTWVHGAITHDTENQVLIEGLIVFLTFFLITALLFLRLRSRSFVVSVPMILFLLVIFSLRWRALRESTRDLAVWIRRRLYLTADQVSRGNGSRTRQRARRN